MRTISLRGFVSQNTAAFPCTIDPQDVLSSAPKFIALQNTLKFENTKETFQKQLQTK